MTLPEQSVSGLNDSCPWPGLVAFSEQGSRFFFGRDFERDDVFRRIRRQNTTLLFGKSGLGKTSLLQAGLFPLLRRHGFLPVLMRLDYSATSISPTEQMLATLRQGLSNAGLICSQMDEREGLWEYFHRSDLKLNWPTGQPVIPVLIFDQFEEAFTLGLAREQIRDRTREFLFELTDLIENRPSDELEKRFDHSPELVESYVFDRQPYRIVISLREDYLAAIESLKARAPSLGASRFRLTPMNGQQALEAVTLPAPDIVPYDVALEIIHFISQARREDPFGPAGPPEAIEALEVEPSFLSLFCSELNERRLRSGEARFTRDLVSTSSQSVLEEFYEGTLADQPPALRTFVEEELITQLGFRESMALDRAQASLRRRGIAPGALDLLVQRRLLRVEERLQVTRVEIIHDLLVDVIVRSRTNREQRYVTGSETWTGTSPFRGLQPYDFEHAPVFFGRTEATRSAVERLLSNARSSKPFLLILGTAGVGKSSLVQAGLVASLLSSRALGATLWRRATVHPAGHAEGPLVALTQALALALSEQSGVTANGPPSLQGLSDDPIGVVLAALADIESRARRSDELPAYGVARLVLVVDQLEEIFSDAILPDGRRAFMECLNRFVDSGRIFVIASMRSVFWQRSDELPELVRLSDGLGRFDLLPPSPAELAEIIRMPAQIAGLAYEVHPGTGVGLDAVIVQEAAFQPGVLPLVSFLLEVLYAEDVTKQGGRVLTYAAYERIGGLTGAIATRAERTLNSLPPPEQAELPRVLRAMVSTTGDSLNSLIARDAPIELFPPESESRRLVGALIEARLLVASSKGGKTTVRPAHDALLTHWDRAKGLFIQYRRDLETRTLLEYQSARWLSARRPVSLLLRDPDLANAVDLANRSSDELELHVRDFIRLSDRLHRRRLRRANLLAAAFGLLSVLSLVAFWFAYGQQSVALQQRDAAEKQRALAEQAEQQTKLARDAAEVAGLRAASTISPDGRLLVSVDNDGAKVINLGNGQQYQLATEHPVSSAKFSPDGNILAIGTRAQLDLVHSDDDDRSRFAFRNIGRDQTNRVQSDFGASRGGR